MLVKSEMFWGPVGSVLRAAGQIPVEHDGGRSALNSALVVLRRGGVVGVFPEGNRGKGDAASARAGIAWLALNGHAPVVPVAVLGTRRTGESVGHVPGLRRRLAIEFGEPLVLERAAGTSGRAALERGQRGDPGRRWPSSSTGAVARTGLALPTDDPNRERALAMDPWAWDPSPATRAAPGTTPSAGWPYPPALADALRDALGLDGTGRLLDVGCGRAR